MQQQWDTLSCVVIGLPYYMKLQSSRFAYNSSHGSSTSTASQNCPAVGSVGFTSTGVFLFEEPTSLYNIIMHLRSNAYGLLLTSGIQQQQQMYQ